MAPPSGGYSGGEPKGRPRGGQIPAKRRVPPRNPSSSSPPPVPRREPAVVIPSTITGHRSCIDPQPADHALPPGAVRLCLHSRVQELHYAPGVGHYWRDLRPLLNPLRYYRAANALINAGIARVL